MVCIALKCRLYKDIQTMHIISFTPEQPQHLVSIYSWLAATASKLSDGWSCLPPTPVGMVVVGNLKFRASFPLHAFCSGCIVRQAKSQCLSTRGCRLAFRMRLNTTPAPSRAATTRGCTPLGFWINYHTTIGDLLMVRTAFNEAFAILSV